MNRIDFDVLKAEQLYLYTLLSRATGLESGQHDVDLAATNIAPQYKMRIAEWVTFHTPAPDIAVSKPAEPQISMAEAEAERKNDMDARARLAEYANLGLLDTESNARQIQNWIIANRDGYYNVKNVDDAVHRLGVSLQWKKEESAPPPAPEPEQPAGEVLGTLPNGEKQLPLDADEYVMKRASVKQLLDLNQRRRKASNQMIVGRNHRGFSTTF